MLDEETESQIKRDRSKRSGWREGDQKREIEKDRYS
jgi:hypothetical protein